LNTNQKEKAIGHKSQQPAAAADKIQPRKGAEKKLKAVICIFSYCGLGKLDRRVEEHVSLIRSRPAIILRIKH
jgi:hypothetical protein